MKHIIIQAGGKGKRLEQLTHNKPKALVPVKNLPLIFHLFKKFEGAKFIVIGDYKYDVLEKYLKAFAADADYVCVRANGDGGTCSGLKAALDLVPEHERLMLVWCDLLLPETFSVPEDCKNYIGISKDFKCRWKYEGGIFEETESTAHGVAGLFVLTDKNILADVPLSGEFVRYLSQKQMAFEELSLSGAKEYGLLSEYKKLPTEKCRPFNRLQVQGNKILKEGIDEQGKNLAVREGAWYERVRQENFENIPHIYGTEPLLMEKIDGKNIYECGDMPTEDKLKIIDRIVSCLEKLHGLEKIPGDYDSYYDAYIGKTFSRLQKVRELVPFAKEQAVKINGRKCRNVFYEREKLERAVKKFFPEEFCFLHGDCTFSNIMLKEDKTPVLIDPRGYFGTTELYGDAAYDWAKLYYSLVGNYDQFNLKNFVLDIRENDVSLKINSNNWEMCEKYFWEKISGEVSVTQIKLIHAIIWLSLTTYAWQDYDSVCGAFYNGLYYLEEILGDFYD